MSNNVAYTDQITIKFSKSRLIDWIMLFKTFLLIILLINDDT